APVTASFTLRPARSASFSGMAMHGATAARPAAAGPGWRRLRIALHRQPGGEETAVDRQYVAVDVAGVGREQESHRRGDLARLAVAALRHALVPLAAHVVGVDGARQRRVDGAGRHRVD